MSRAAQMAKDEADRVEADEAAEREAAEHEADTPPIPAEHEDAADLAAPSLDETMAMLEAEHERHRVSLETILGEDFGDFQECAVCNALGYRAVGDVPFDPTLTRCQTCGGHGLLQTHSRNPEHAIRPCLECQGQGFKVRTETPPVPVVPPAPPVARYDPYTGQPLPSAANGAAADGPFAPGYIPPATSAQDAFAGPRY